MAHLLRARPRPHPARHRVPPPGRQDAGVRLPRRPPAHPAHPRARGRPGRHVDRPGARAQRRAHRGHRARPRLRPRSRRPRQRGRPRRRTSTAATTTPSWGADVALAPLNLCAETLDGIRNHSWSRPAPATPEGEVVSLGRPHRLRLPRLRGRRGRRHRRAPTMLPAVVAERCGASRVAPARRVHHGDGRRRGRAPGASAWPSPTAEALAAFRRFNYEHIYLRPASCRRPTP